MRLLIIVCFILLTMNNISSAKVTQGCKENCHATTVYLYGKKYTVKESSTKLDGDDAVNISLINGSTILNIDTYQVEGSFIPKIEALSIYRAKDNVNKLIVLVSRQDTVGRSHSDFNGISYQIYIYSALVKRGNITNFSPDEMSMKNNRNGQVGVWDNGQVEKFKFTTIGAIKTELEKEETSN
jgi:hypothetical protein